MTCLNGVRRIHIVGIGGAGMSALARLLHQMGYAVTGSDAAEGDHLAGLRALGLPVTVGHDPAAAAAADLVGYSAAIPPDDPDLLSAKWAGVPTAVRAALLEAVSQPYARVAAVAGTHGKTTATGMLTEILLAAGRDPSVLIGGELPSIGGGGRLGRDGTLVCEACEFQDTFLSLKRDLAVILNIDDDHLEYFGTGERLEGSFRAFAAAAGQAVVYGEDPRVLRALKGLPVPLTTFGFGQENDHFLDRVTVADGCWSGDWRHCGRTLGRLTLRVAGRHNLLNALAAAAAATAWGVEPETVCRALARFAGVGRRFEVLARLRGVTVADDYAHHPTELRAVLTAARQRGYRRIVALFQPFTFSRTFLLMDDFAAALGLADAVVLVPILGAREQNDWGVSAADLARRIPGAALCDTFDEAARAALDRAGEGDLVLTLGCGDVYKAARRAVALLAQPVKNDPPRTDRKSRRAIG